MAISYSQPLPLQFATYLLLNLACCFMPCCSNENYIIPWTKSPYCNLFVPAHRAIEKHLKPSK